MMLIKNIAFALIPPQDEDPKVTIFRWLMWTTVVGLCISMLWVINNLAFSSELGDVKRDVAQMKRENLESQIFQKSIDVCSSSGQLRTAHNQEMSRLIGQWRDIVGDQTAMPSTWKSCQELGLVDN